MGGAGGRAGQSRQAGQQGRAQVVDSLRVNQLNIEKDVMLNIDNASQEITEFYEWSV